MLGKEMSDPVSSPKKHDFKTSILQGLSAAWPICLGYIPIGIASLTNAKDSAAAVLKRADQALYRAKRDGRNRVVPDAA